MIELRSIGRIRKNHNFARELASIPVADWMTSKQLEDYDKTKKQTLEKLEVIDGNIELLLSKLEDENLRLAIKRAFYLDKEVSFFKEVGFREYLPQGKVQIQYDLIDMLVRMASGERPLAKDSNQKKKEREFQKEWKANPKIGTVKIDDRKTEQRLQNSLELFSDYLNACEHEFYKQTLAAKLRSIIHEYHMLLWHEEHEGKEVESKLIEEGDYILNYYHLGDITDRIYYWRARDFLVGCRDCWNFLHGNEHSRKYLLKWEDIYPEIKV
ncbi:MAG: hypothetical protein GTN36_04180 [Candidatus Aenigmarchaeota archaeon]|nr:hypothetical protein [Candidatus Aenigmarchaeota archaeon]